MTSAQRQGCIARGFDGLERHRGKVWAIVLAGGDGTRLAALTGDHEGNRVPKQFCSLAGGPSLLEQTLVRAQSVVAAERVTAVVCAGHAQHWEHCLQVLDPQSVVVQPANRGTALGILLPLLRIVARDPDARVLVLPSDHYVHDEPALERCMRAALLELRRHPAGVVLLGIEAEEPDPELGYIVPGFEPSGSFETVRRFVEKPPVEEAARLCRDGAVWNSFILACRAQSLLDLYLPRHRDVVEALQGALLRAPAQLEARFARLPAIDFSRDIVSRQETRLALMRVPRCGWNDLGTPERLARTLARYHPDTIAGCIGGPGTVEGRINLAHRLMRAYPQHASSRAGAGTAVAPAARPSPRTAAGERGGYHGLTL